MSNSVFGVFQIGPVQDFISCARRTQDFWSGSFLLSCLNALAITVVVKECGGDEKVIIFPAVEDQPLYKYISKNFLHDTGELIFEEKIDEKILRPTIPNRFVAALPENAAKAILDKTGTKIQQAFSCITQKIERKLWDKITSEDHPLEASFSFDGWHSIWTRQTSYFFEIYWTISKMEPADTQYQQTFKEAMRFFNARKAIRDFSPNLNQKEAGFKCTLCGERESLHAFVGEDISREKIRQFWQILRGVTNYSFKEDEHLCAICTSKRLAPEYIFHRSGQTPSTSTLAAADFVNGITLQFKSADDYALIDKFVDGVGLFASKLKRNCQIQPLSGIKNNVQNSTSLNRLIHLEGEWFFDDTYENIRYQNRKNGSTDIEKQLVDMRSNFGRLIERNNKLSGQDLKPSKYLGLFFLDGDDMGKHISECNIEGHRSLSQEMCLFSQKFAPEIIDEQLLGKIIYFGGDEGAAFTSLNDLLPAMWKCYRQFTSRFEKWQVTACAGGVIAHHQHNLRDMIQQAHAALDRAKQLGGKNCFNISILKRSGEAIQARSKWSYAELDIIDQYLHNLIKLYIENKITDAWWRELKDEAKGLTSVQIRPEKRTMVDVELAKLEISRLLARHSKIETASLGKQTQLLLEETYYTTGEWEDFWGLMELASFIRRGGD